MQDLKDMLLSIAEEVADLRNKNADALAQLYEMDERTFEVRDKLSDCGIRLATKTEYCEAVHELNDYLTENTVRIGELEDEAEWLEQRLSTEKSLARTRAEKGQPEPLTYTE